MATSLMSHGPALYSRRQRPSSAKLAGVKYELYHPALPTLRRMSMDDVTHKLSTEHSRTSTPCDRGKFASARSTLRKRGWSDPNLPCKSILSKHTTTVLSSSEKLKTRTFTDNWKAILSTLNSSSRSPGNSQDTKQKHTGTQTDYLQLQINGLASRTLHPDFTGSWQNNRPNSAQWSRPSTAGKQMPATMYTRYRGSRTYSANPWK